MNIPIEWHIKRIVANLYDMDEKERVTAIKEVIEHFNQLLAEAETELEEAKDEGYEF